MELKIKKVRYIILLTMIGFLLTMVLARDKVYAEQEEYTFGKGDSTADLAGKMGLNQKTLQKVLTNIGINANPKKFTSNGQIIFDPTNHTVQNTKGNRTWFQYNVETGDLAESYASYSKEDLMNKLFTETIPKDNFTQFKQIMDTGKIDVNEPVNASKMTIVQFVIQDNKSNIFKYLTTRNDTKWNLPGCDGCTPILTAIRTHRSRFLEEIIKCMGNVDPDIPDANGIFPLEYSIDSNDLKMVQLILETKLFNVNRVNPKDNLSPLFRAVGLHNSEIVEALLNSGTDPNLKCRGFSPLIIAVKNNNESIVRLLCQKNPDLVNTATDDQGFTPLQYAVGNIKLNTMVQTLLKLGASPTLCKENGSYSPLFLAIQRNNVSAVQSLCQQNPNLVNENTSGDGYTNKPLMVAVELNNNNMVSELLNLGADPASKDSNGTLPIHKAVANNYFQIVRTLVQHDRNLIDSPTDSGLTPLMQTILSDDIKLAEFLINNGTDVNGNKEITPGVDVKGSDLTKIPIFLAISRCTPQIVKLISSHNNFHFIGIDIMGNSMELVKAVIKSKKSYFDNSI